MMNMMDFQDELPQELREAAAQFLLGGNILEMTRDEDGCFDILVRNGDSAFWTELTLDGDFYIADSFCPVCGTELCVHTVAALYAAQLMICTGSGYEEAMGILHNQKR